MIRQLMNDQYKKWNAEVKRSKLIHPSEWQKCKSFLDEVSRKIMCGLQGERRVKNKTVTTAMWFKS